MWPWSATAGWYRVTASRTATLPPPVVRNRPASRMGLGSSPGRFSSLRQVSIGVSFGGQWRLNTHRPTSGTEPTEAVDRRRDLVLARLARRVPRRHRGQADRDHRVLVVQVHDPVLARDHVGPVVAFEDLQHRRFVVVAARQVHPDTGAGQPVLRQLEPPRQPFGGQPTEPPELRQLVGADRLVLVRLEHLPVEARELDALGERVEPVPFELVIATLEVGSEAPVRAHDRDEGLAHEVATEHERVGLVERRRAEELAERRLGAVEVGREEDVVGLAFDRTMPASYPRSTTIVLSSVRRSIEKRPPTRPTPLGEPARPPNGRWDSQ